MMFVLKKNMEAYQLSFELSSSVSWALYEEGAGHSDQGMCLYLLLNFFFF
jgi:hypothetical protein